jgi:hypothetical protein
MFYLVLVTRLCCDCESVVQRLTDQTVQGPLGTAFLSRIRNVGQLILHGIKAKRKLRGLSIIFIERNPEYTISKYS